MQELLPEMQNFKRHAKNLIKIGC